MNLRSKVSVRGLAGFAAVASAAACMIVGTTASPSAAATASVSLDYTCTFPLIGYQPMSVKITETLPDNAIAGQQTAPIPYTADVTVGAKATQGLAFVSSATIAGSATAQATFVDGSTSLNLSLPLTVASTPVPASGSFVVHASGQAPGLTLPNPGTATITVGNFVTKLTPLESNNGPTGLGTFYSTCTPDPGQDLTLGSFPVAAPTSSLNFGVSGTTHIKALNADAAVGPGTLTASLDSTGAFSGDLSLPPTSTSFDLFGFIPGTSSIQLQPAGKTTGTYANGAVTSDTKENVQLTNVTLFGLPLVSNSTTCQTATPADIQLSSGSNPFSLTTGGTLTGTYTLDQFTGCGLVTGFVSAVASGAGNTISVDVTPHQ